MSAEPSESDRAALAAYQELRDGTKEHFLHAGFCDENPLLASMDGFEEPAAALWSYYKNPGPKVLLAVLDDLSIFFHVNDEYKGPEFEYEFFEVLSRATFESVQETCAMTNPADFWKPYVKTMHQRYEIFSLRSRLMEKEVKLACPPEGGCKGNFLHYLRMSQNYTGEVAPRLKRHTAHRLMHIAKGIHVPYRSAHWGFLDALDWGRKLEPTGFDLVAWEKHVTEMQDLYEKLPHPDKVIETQEEKAGIERLRAERDVHGNPPELTTPENPCGYTPSQLEHLNKHHS